MSAQIAPPIREAQRLAESTGRSVAIYQKSSGEYYLVQEAYEVLPGSSRRHHIDPPAKHCRNCGHV